MLRFFSGLFMIGIGLYVAAVFFIGSDTGETLSDMGNAALLITTAGLLLRSARQA